MAVTIGISITEEDNTMLLNTMSSMSLGKSEAMQLILKRARDGEALRAKKDKEILILKDLIQALRENNKETEIYLINQLSEIYKEEIKDILG